MVAYAATPASLGSGILAIVWSDSVDKGQSDGDELDPSVIQRIGEIQSMLTDVSDRLGDVSMDLIRTAIEQGSVRPSADKTLARARRAVDKAATLLGGID